MSNPAHLSDYQNEIYLNALLQGALPPASTDLLGLEHAAVKVMDPDAVGYVVGCAGSGATNRANREAFDRWRIVPRMLRDVGERDQSCTVLGTPMPAPVLLGPVGVQSIIHRDGELATARAAASLGVPMVLSTASSHPLEEVAEANGAGPRWFQLYWPKDPDVTVSLLDRAKAAGYSVLVVTLDTRMLAWRPADLDRGFLPFLRQVGVANYFTDPAFAAGLAKPVEEDPIAALLHWVAIFADPSTTWADLAFLRRHWDGPIVVKGICSADDARLAVDHGMNGVVVSNHGGRQVDGAVAALDALPAVADAVADQIPVLFDSGVRTGADAVKALALGAQAVLLGRPYVYGLALAGQAGVEHVLRSLMAELDLTIGLAGYRSYTQLDRAALAGPTGS